MSEPTKAVFLSYASQDAQAAKRICEALRTAGVEVWFDQSELVGGDQWDGKIRGQISSCALFVPIISANTQARLEGYFRLEWKLAAQRTHTMADEKPFLLPILIDGTRDAEAKVPAEFKAVQWTKLMGGETPPAFCTRVKRLLSGEQGAGSKEVQPQNPEPGTRNRAQRPRWLAPVIAGGVIAVLALILARPWEKAAPPPPVSTQTAEPVKPAVPVTEARQLAAKAQLLFEKVDSTQDDFTAAEGLMKRAVALDPSDGLVLAIYSRLNTGFSMRGFDYSAARVEEARSQMEQAMRLAPEEAEVWLARGSYLRRTEGSRAEAELALRKALALAPHDTRPWFDLAWAVGESGKDEEVFALLEKSIDPARPGSGALARYNQFNLRFAQRRFAEADTLVRASVAELPSSNFVTGLARNEITWKGNAPAAVAIIEQMPSERLKEPRSVYFAAYARLLVREPAAALNALRRLPADFIQDSYFTGPKGYWEGRAQQQLGNAEAAKVAWEGALEVSRREGAGRFKRGLIMQAELLALLGRQEEALRTVLAYEQSGGTEGISRRSPWTYSAAKVYAALGRVEEALPLLEAHLAMGSIWPLTPALLRIDPLWDKIRNDSRFQKLCAEPAPITASSLSLSTPPDAKSVAVLAFANLSDDKGNEYFSDGISEELLNVLAKIPGLKVAARTSAFYFKGKEVPIPEIAHQLRVAYVVEGSVRKQGDKVRITAQLIKAADGFHVWSDTFTRDLKDIFAVQDEIAGLIAQNLELKMGVGTLEARREVNPEAHRLLLEGWHHLALRTAAGFDQAETAFNAALKLDPKFAPAHSGLANVSALRGRYRVLAGLGRSNEFAALALAQGRLALQLDPSLAEAHAAMGSALTDNRQFDEADAEFRQALAVNPSYGPSYHWYCHVFAGRGRLDLALQQTDRSVALDPYAFIAHFIRIAYATDARRFASALAEADQAATLRAEVFLPNEAERIRCLVGLGRRKEAVAVARRALQHPDLLVTGWWCAGDALYALRQCGAEAEALVTGEALLKRIAPDNYMRGYVLCALGRYAEGLPALATAPAIVQGRLSWIPMFDAVRDTPAYQQLMVRLNCVEEDKVARATLARMLKEQEAKK